MFTPDTPFSESSECYYQSLNEQLAALLAGETDFICNSAQFSAFIMQTLDDLNWAGFYFARKNELVLGPYVGKVACTRIPFGRGVCGKAAMTATTQRIANVHEFEGHIACDVASASELVVPLIVGDALLGVFDIDSPKVNRFSEVDQIGIQTLLATFLQATKIQWSI
ncbi:GAF domain-containing protein [Marinomonas posidonica]|uniref:GAF domain protein n=1 Tax=Marinomonas posidonica (strain CECT 7376 / NCIMB 14433 / IVIA-Po-181) TaxID=491952 RepID=F6CVN5_MARPP|nr:GAF domain-containing protein [Marinomonas posidonica]AEF56509.1 GAF domain protein [Marinomonas posidonica IVIA-Po-181]